MSSSNIPKPPNPKRRFAKKGQDLQASFDAVRSAALNSRTEPVVNPVLRQEAQLQPQITRQPDYTSTDVLPVVRTSGQAPPPSLEAQALQRFQYQGQSGFDASKTMKPSSTPSRRDRKAAERIAGKTGKPAPHRPLDSFSDPVKETECQHLLSNPLDNFAQARDWRYWLNMLAIAVFSLVLVVASLGTALAIVSAQPTNAGLIAFAHAGYPQNEIEARQEVAAEILRYVSTLPFESVRQIDISQEDLDTLKQWSLGEYELCHLSDVRILLGRSLMLAYVLILISAMILVLTRNTQFARHSLLVAGIACIALPLIMGLFIFFFFEPTFVLFHEIFFPQGNWTFSPNTLLISTLPTRYWQTAGMLWMGLFMVNGLILTGLSRFCGKMHVWSVTND